MIIRRIINILFKLYHWTISPLLGSRCRYVPSCSDYSQQAIETHGVAKGLWLTCGRLCRCHPWGGCGHDPVPSKTCNTKREQSP